MQQNSDIFGGSGRGLNMNLPHEVSPISFEPWASQHTPVHCSSDPLQHHVDPFLVPPPPTPYASFFNRKVPNSMHFPYDSPSSTHDHLRFISNTFEPGIQPGSAPYGLQAELMSKMTAQDIMDAKALAASKSHSEAERRRRERINNHLAKLRSLLPNTTKTDKASLLAEVIQHVKELKQQTSLFAETSPIPTEIDELTVDTLDTEEEKEEGDKFVIKASICCQDRSDLLSDLVKALKDLRLRTQKAEISTLGGRVKNVLFITGDKLDDEGGNSSTRSSSIQEALKAVMEKTVGDDQSSSGSTVKRQRSNYNINILERHI